MSLNLITDAWIPVLMREGDQRIVAPWQITDTEVLRLDWARADFNIACLELLIGLIFLADPPEDAEDWFERQTPNPQRLRERLERFAPAFELMGNGPRFLQDLEPLVGDPNLPDMLFIDSAGGQTQKNNADLMVWRDRYPTLTFAIAAMALYTFQAFAPSGGAGNRTSMRGGGPLVTLIDPGGNLWSLIWANVPDGQASEIAVLPWMRPTVQSQGEAKVWPRSGREAEAFFGMPRRLRLVAENDRITGIIQRPHGNNYAGWIHPLSPYYRQKSGSELLPQHPRSGLFGYRNWLGVAAASVDEGGAGLRIRAAMVRTWHERTLGQRPAQVIVAGWAMSNMKPQDFTYSTPPLVQLGEQATRFLNGLVEAADQLARALRWSLAFVLAEGESREAVREQFFSLTQQSFEDQLAALVGSYDSFEQARIWLNTLRPIALDLFDAIALPGLADRKSEEQQKIIGARQALLANFAGRGAYGKRAYASLELEPVARKQNREVAA